MIKPKIIEELNALKNKISKCKELIDYCDRMSLSLGGQSFDVELVDHTRNFEAPFVKWIYKRIENEEKLKVLENEYSKVETKLNDYLLSFDEADEIKIIAMRYLQGYEWITIQNELFMSESMMFRTHRKALNRLKNIEEKNDSC